MNPRYLDDIDKKVTTIPFGELDIKVIRHRSKTAKVAYEKSATIVPKSNEQAFSDLEKLINSLITSIFTGKVEFALDFEKGTIKLITIKNKEIKTYGDQNG